ncbi:MAG: ATPase [Rickettsiales bacterium]|nr:MAG: ATPase [Rickettsiales bacterium]
MQDFPFMGREYELKSLYDLTQKKSASLVVLRGRRRIGKSRLAKEFATKYKPVKCRFISFAGLVPTNDTAATQKEEFARQLAKNLNLPPIKADDWGDIFTHLARETQSGRVVILFDEISWMGSKDPSFLGKLKNAWDLEFKNNSNLILILCGSVSSWIEENILKSTGFMGRLSLVLDLQELKLDESNQFLSKIGFCDSVYERFKVLSVTGGVPRYLEEINPSKLADENIKDLCFKSSGILFREFNDIFLDIFARRSKTYEKITRTLVTGRKELKDIAKAIGTQKSGHLSEYLSDLVKSGFIKRDYVWRIKDNKESKLSYYRLSDNYLRFYLKYIEPNKSKIENGHFDNKALSTLPAFDSIMGLQFENLVLANRQLVLQKLNISPEDVVNDHPYFQRPQQRVEGCQIDYLIQLKQNILYACEVKFSRKEAGMSVIQDMKQKLDKFILPKGFAIIPVLININGVSDSVRDSDYFRLIDFSDMLN